MNPLITIIQKELRELLRDKKTIINSIVLPTILVPLLILGSVKITQMIQKKKDKESIKIGLVNAPKDFMAIVTADTLNEVVQLSESIDFKRLIDDDTVATTIVFPKGWNSIMDNLGTAHVQIYRNGTKDNVNNRTTEILSTFKRAIEKERLARLNVDPVKLVPIQEEVIEISEQKELLGKRLGGFIPYLFILSMWGGCLLAGIDLVTGEKERKTIETTLSLPVSSFSILMGKTVVASLLGFIPALLNLIGLIIGLKFIEGIPAFIQSAINEMLSFQSVSLILLLLIPFALFLSSIIIALITGAKTFKEAQSKATPIIMAIILPLVLAMMPGIELNWTTAFIPVLNIGLAIKEVMAGTINMAYYSVILVSLIAFAIGAIYLSYRKFNDERAILG